MSLKLNEITVTVIQNYRTYDYANLSDKFVRKV